MMYPPTLITCKQYTVEPPKTDSPYYRNLHDADKCHDDLHAHNFQFMNLMTVTYIELEHARLDSTWHNWVWSKGVADRYARDL